MSYWAPRKIAASRRTPQNCLRLIPLCSRSDSWTFTLGLSAIGGESNFSRCPVVSLCPLVIAVEVLLEPGVASRDALRRFAVVHVVIQVRDDEGDGRQRGVVAGKVREPQIGRGVDRRSVGNVREADLGHMLAAVNTLVRAAVRRIEIDRRADAG